MNRSQRMTRNAGFRILAIYNERRKVNLQRVKLGAYLRMMTAVGNSENKEQAIVDYINKVLYTLDEKGIEASHLRKILKRIGEN